MAKGEIKMVKMTYFLTISLGIILTIIIIQSAAYAKEYSVSDNYNYYKSNFLMPDGRVIDPKKNNITTSESQSYIMLMSLAMNDKSTFDQAYTWTKSNLQLENNLFSWLYGKDKNGDFKVLDKNSAADADIDIAAALLYAYEKWKDKKYLDEAKKIIAGIWANETKIIGDKRVLFPGIIQTSIEKQEINPSYLSTYNFKMFQKYDADHDWKSLVDSSYYYLNLASKRTQTGLFPDWAIIQGENLFLEEGRGNFTYDAIRVFPRLYIDYKMTGDRRALALLKKSQFLIKDRKKNKPLYTNYKPNGEVKDKYELIGSIAALIPAINTYNKKAAKEIYDTEILTKLKNDGYYSDTKAYYAQSLLWFGMYLYLNEHKNK